MTPEERALANEYAEEPYDIGLGEGYTEFFDQDAAPITAETANDMDDGVSLDVSETSAEDSLDMDDGASIDSDAGYGDGMDSGQDSGMSIE